MYFFNVNLGDSTTSGTLTPKLLLRVSQLDMEFDPSPWSPKTWEKLPDEAFEALFLLTERDLLLGIAVFRTSPEEGLAHLLKFLITPARRREGLGELLLAKAFDILRGQKLEKIYLEVEKGNPAFLLYRKMGLEKIHEIADFYGPGRPGLVMISNN
ncbi:MAG: GNAT family N-acetyltransferase [Deltaproteobacteria bacterium]|nr:MAG: GNAT family N-acetyltransferase [Deltaproteobacteria bacterium]